MSFLETIEMCIEKIGLDYIADIRSDSVNGRWFYEQADLDLSAIIETVRSATVIGEVSDRQLDDIKDQVDKTLQEICDAYYYYRDPAIFNEWETALA